MNGIMWEPSDERKRNSSMTRFMDFVNKRGGTSFGSYEELYRWSVDRREEFWEYLWDFTGVIHSVGYDRVLENGNDMLNSGWFVGSRMNFAENLLRFRDDRPALVFKSESPEKETLRMSYGELYEHVSGLASSLRKAGVGVGDRVVGFVPNIPEAVIAMLAAVSIGAIWSSCSPDFGFRGVLDRFGQIRPKIMFVSDGYLYNGKEYGSLEKTSEILRELPSIEKVIVIPFLKDRPNLDGLGKSVHYGDFFEPSKDDIEFEQLPFDHPVYILYTSGTTGVPKCMVHGAGGTLLQHLKELILHTDLKREDRIFYFTTCGWMMWNWLVSSLAVGSSVMLFDGSPFHPDSSVLWRFAQDERITVFGTSAKYLAALEKDGRKPGREFDLSPLRTILSTGSTLSVDSFDYVYRDIKKDVQLSSISGGSDLISCFALGNPILPVRRGELQCRGLGMKVEIFDETGNPMVEENGELVCTASFPSQPIYFWNDPGKERYRSAYFETYDNVWHHGDYARLTENGGLIIYGRSDATLNPGGVRIGTAEIYRPVEAMDEVMDSLVVGQAWGDDVRVILFVKMAPGAVLNEELERRIRSTIRENATPRHVPAKIIPVDDIPYTISGKKVELAVKKIIEGRPVLNRDALKNPESLDLFRNIPQLGE